VKLRNLVFYVGTLFAATGTVSAVAADNTSTFNPDQVKQIQQVIHDYLVKNPQVLVEASEVLQKQAMAKVEQNAKGAIAQNADKLFGDSSSPVGGNAKGKITLVEFFDYQCPHCKDVKALVGKVVAGNGQVRVVYKELPIFGANSKFATAAALAAAKQDPQKYVKLHEAMMAASNPLTNDKVIELAKSVGLNIDQLKKDMDSDSIKQQIEDNYKLAQTIGIVGTPSFIIATWDPTAKGGVKNITFIPGVPTQADLQNAVNQAQR
jgi:protein-disulfide isomerase